MKTAHESAMRDLAEEFVARCRAGESPEWQDYAADHPELAADIEEVFPLMQFVDGAASSRLTERGSAGDETIPTLAREVVGDYRIIREIGRGGMGVVYEAEQISLKRRVALKVQSRGHEVHRKADKRFRQEAQAAAQLVHPNIVPVYDVGEDGEFAYYAMQLIEGQPLDEFIDDVRKVRKSRDKGRESRDGRESVVSPQVSVANSRDATHNEPLATDPSSQSQIRNPKSEIDTVSASSASGRGYFRFVARVGRQVADALAYAHNQGVIHRDIKPSNLLLDRDLSAWITDFGLAKVGDNKLTQTGDVLGTVRYMAPEQFRGWADPRSDVYSLGATLYELVALQPTHKARDRIELIRQITSDEPKPLRKLDPRIPRDLETIIHKSLRKEPAERYASADDLRDDLRRFLRGEPIRARHDSLVYRTRKAMRRYRAALVAAGLIVLALAIGLVGMIVALRQKDEVAAELRVAADANRNLAQESAKLAEQRRVDLYFADIREAFRKHRERRPEVVRQILKRHVPRGNELDLRGVEWHLLDRLSRQPTPIVLDGHEGPVHDVCVVPGKQRVVSVGEDGMICVWDDTTGKLLQNFCASNFPLDSIAVSLDGRYVAVGNRDSRENSLCEAWLWDLESEEPIRMLCRVPSTVDSLAFSPDGERVAAGERYGDVWLVNVADGEPINHQYIGGRNSRIRFMPDGDRLICIADVDAAPDREAFRGFQIWNAELTETLQEFSLGLTDTLALSRDGHWLAAAGSRDERVYLHALKGEAPLYYFRHIGDRVNSIEIAPDDDRLAVGHADGSVQVWQLDKVQVQGEQTEAIVSERIKVSRPKKFRGHKGPIPATTFTNDGRLVTCGHDGLIRIWPDLQAMPNWVGPPELSPYCLAVGPDEASLAVGIAGSHHLWMSRGTPSQWHHVPLKAGRMTHFAYSPDGRFLAVKQDRSDLVLLNGKTFGHVRVLTGGNLDIGDVKFSHDGEHVIAACSDGVTRVWRTQGGTIVQKWKHESDPRCVAVSARGHVAVGGEFRYIDVYDLATTDHLFRLDNEGEAQCLAWSPDGTVLASGQMNRDIVLWRTGTDAQPVLLGSHTETNPSTLRFLDGGSRLVSRGARDVRLWHVPTRQELGLLFDVGAPAVISGLEVAPDGSRLYVSVWHAAYEHNVSIWPLK